MTTPQPPIEFEGGKRICSINITKQKGGSDIEKIAEQEIRANMSALYHQDVPGVKEWFIYLPTNRNPNVVFDQAREMGLGESYAAALKTLHQHRSTCVFKELIR